MAILSTLESLPTHIVTSPSTNLCSFCNSCFKLLIIATEPVSNTQGLLWTLVKYTSITCISNIPFVHFAILLSRQVSRAVPLPVTISFAVEAVSFRLWSSFGLLHGSDNLLAILLEVPFLSLAILLETSGLVNHQHLMISWFLPSLISASQRARESLLSSLAYYSSSWSSSNLVMVTRELCQSLFYLED